MSAFCVWPRHVRPAAGSGVWVSCFLGVGCLREMVGAAGVGGLGTAVTDGGGCIPHGESGCSYEVIASVQPGRQGTDIGVSYTHSVDNLDAW